MKQIVPLLLSLLLTPLSLLANERVALKGRIVSAEDKSPIEFATVYIASTYVGTVTNLKGEFELQVEADSPTTIAVSMMGFETLLREVNPTHGFLTLELRPSALALEEVTVVARSQAEQMQDRGFALSHISAERASVQHVSTEELLNRSAGVKIRQGGGVGSETQYNINGLSGGSVKVYVDGVPISSYGSSYSIANIPASSIERIEVYKGVVPAHLADDALGGAINVITKRGGVKSLTASYAYGSYNTHSAHLEGLYKDAKSGFFAGGSLHFNHSDNNYKVWGDAVFVTNPETGRVERIVAERFHDDYTSYGAKFTTGVMGKRWSDELRFTLFANAFEKDIQTGATMESVYGNRRSGQQSYMGSLSYRKNNLLPRLHLNSTLSYSLADRTITDTCNVKYNWSGNPVTNILGEVVHWGTTGEGGRATLAQNLEQSFNNRTSLRYALDAKELHTLSLNGSVSLFSREVNDPLLSALEQSLTEARRIEKYTLSSSYDAKLFAKRLNVSLFYKYIAQRLSLSDPISENGEIVPHHVDAPMRGSGYGATASWRIASAWRISGSAERALRLPGITEMIGNVADNIEPNYNLRPEHSNNFNLGASAEQIRWGRHRMDGNITLFYRDVNDMIQRAEVNQGDETYGFENLGKIVSKGVDLELAYHYGKRLSLTGATSYTDARFNVELDENGAPYLWYGDRLRNMPFFTANGGASYAFEGVGWRGDNLSLGYHINYVHAFFKNWESVGAAGKATIPSQLSHDVSLLYRLPKGRISVGVDAKNLLNAPLFDNYALQKMGRMVSAKITYKIR